MILSARERCCRSREVRTSMSRTHEAHPRQQSGRDVQSPCAQSAQPELQVVRAAQIRNRASTIDDEPHLLGSCITNPTHPPPSHLHRIRTYVAMASRRLALNLKTSIRSRAALNAVRPQRGFASPISHGATTETTTLKNGFTVLNGFETPIGLDADGILRSPRNILLGLKPRPLVSG